MSQNSPPKKVALVTGGSRGIGRAVVEALAGAGWTVHFCSKSPDSVREAASAFAERFADAPGGAPTGEPVDVRDQSRVDAWVESVADGEGRIDLLVNNAGLGRFGAVDELGGEEFREVIETNLNGCFYLMRAVAPVMKRQGGGFIVNVASLAGKNPFAGGAAYNASKFGLVGLSDAAMLDLRHDGVRVTVILPGSVDTDFHRRDERDWMMRPEDVARTVTDLLAYPPRTLPSRVEMRPTAPPK